MFGALQLILSQLPDIHTLRHVNILATFCTVAFSATVVAMCIHNGARCRIQACTGTFLEILAAIPCKCRAELVILNTSGRSHDLRS